MSNGNSLDCWDWFFFFVKNKDVSGVRNSVNPSTMNKRIPV